MQERRTCCSVAALLTIALWCGGSVRAAPAATSSAAPSGFGSSKVIVVDPPASDRVLIEAGLRIRSELDAVGLSNRSAACASEDVGAEGCGEIASAAAIALSREDGLATIRVVATLPDGYELRRDVRVPPEAGGDDPAVLAVRAVELLRDIYLDVPRAAPPREAPPPRAEEIAAVAVAPARPPRSEARQLSLSLAAAMLAGQKGLGPAAAPMLEVGMTLGHGFTVTAAAAGPFEATVGGAGAIARTREALAMAGVRYEYGQRQVRPYATLAAGMHYIRAEGVPQTMAELGVVNSAKAPLVVGGGGVSVTLFRWLALTGGVAAAFTMPSTNVRISGDVVGKSGGPSFLGQLGLSVTFAAL